MTTPPSNRNGHRRQPRGIDGLLSFHHIAEATGMSQRSVRRIYSRAIRKLRARCDELGVTYEDFMAYLVARDVTTTLDLPAALIPDAPTLADLTGDDDDDDANGVV